MSDKTIHEKLLAVQSAVHVPKSQKNTFGGYNYRSCEDILEAVKKLAHQEGCTVTLTDIPVEIGGRIYIKATASLRDGAAELSADGYAHEEETKKGMDGSQITGAASSYARKYALNGLFAIDDTKDSDATNQHGKTSQQGTSAPRTTPAKPAPRPAPQQPAAPKPTTPPAKQVQPEQKPGTEKPTITKVLESLTDCKDPERLEMIYHRACTFEWSKEDAQGIASCYDSVRKRLGETSKTPEAAKAA